jgi:hypothetical protein
MQVSSLNFLSISMTHGLGNEVCKSHKSVQDRYILNHMRLSMVAALLVRVEYPIVKEFPNAPQRHRIAMLKS